MTTTNTALTDTTIYRADERDLATISQTLAAAFADDPVFAWCIPDDTHRAALLPRFFELFTATVLPYGEVEATASGGAATLWIPAGQPAVPEDQAEAFGDQIVDIFGGDSPELDRTFAIMELLDSVHPADDHRFLWFIGVQPRHQGHGLGSLLLASMLQRCDRDGTPAYLDATSPLNRRLYERHGFVVTGENQIDSSPPLWSMWRDPQDHQDPS